MDKKNILIIFTGAMEIGGIERSLLGLLESFDYERFNVDLFLYGHYGILFSQIDKHVNILPEVKELAYLRESFGTKIKNGCFISSMIRVKDEIVGKIRPVDHDASWAQVMRMCTPKQKKHYDMAISFFRPFDYLVEKVDADIKIGWVHTDYTKANEALAPLIRDYSKVDYIAAVSDSCAEAFKALFPQFSSKVITVGNILSESFIMNEAKKIDISNEMPADGNLKFLSVGRFCEAKNFDNVPYICKRIQEKGINVKWYLIGFGSDEQLIRDKIEETSMNSSVIILGKKDNPYPYIQACDFYIQPSRYEGKCVSVIEAQMLHKPVIIANYPTASSQLINGYDGVIVPQNNDECAEAIVNVISDNLLVEQIIENTRKTDYSNKNEIEKLYNLMEKS